MKGFEGLNIESLQTYAEPLYSHVASLVDEKKPFYCIAIFSCSDKSCLLGESQRRGLNNSFSTGAETQLLLETLKEQS